MEIQQVVPAVGDAVDDDDFGSSLFADADSFDVGFGSVVLQREHPIISQMGVEVCRSVLRVDYGHFAPVARHPVGDQQRRVGFTRSRCALQGQPHFGFPALRLS